MQFSTHTLKVGPFTAKIMEADRLVGDRVFGLPPGSPLAAYKVSQFITRPDHWIDEPGSYVVVVKPNKGLWFDWRGNDSLNTAILPSVKGCNPITGLPTSGFELVSRGNKCPKHGIELKAAGYCPECGYSLPPQNYVCAPNTLWWDGFRSEDGTVRQFFFTEDEMRDVASHLTGKASTVPAFGFAFYSKCSEHVRKHVSRSYSGSEFFKNQNMKLGFGEINHMVDYNDLPYYGTSCSTADMTKSFSYTTAVALNCCSVSPDMDNSFSPTPDMNMSKFVKGKTLSRGIEKRSKSIDVSVGAGAKINQSLAKDDSDINTWKKEPDAVMRIYFIFQSEFEKWRQGGMKCLEDVESSMLAGIPVG